MIENVITPNTIKNSVVNITLLGPQCCGKTTIANLIVNNVPNTNYVHTAVPQLFYFTLQSNTEDTVKYIEIEDTSLKCEYHYFYSIINSKKRDYFLIIFDATDNLSWDNAKSMFVDVKNHNQTLYSREPFMAIVAHKTDLNYSKELVGQAQSFASANNIHFFKTSIRDREMVRKMIRQVISQLDF